MLKSKIEDEKYMRLALRLALKAKGRTNPNPLVGAVVVKKGRIVGQGYHQAVGLPHAEVMALNKAGKAACAAKLYVTLEPCCHFGKTAPCVHKIVASGIKEVIFAMRDPNPLNNGKGTQFLRRKGIKVTCGILEEEARKVNQVFIKYITKGMPFVTVKVAQSLDGKIAAVSGDSRWISSEASRRFAHQLRSQVDAVLVGINTVLKDNPLLSCRLNGSLQKKQPKKVIVDSRLRLRPDLNIFSSASPAQVIIATTESACVEDFSNFKDKAQIMLVKDRQNRVDLKELLRKLAKQGIAHLLVEGGGEIIASILENRLADRMIVVIGPKIIGGRNAPTAVEGRGVERIKAALQLEEMQVQKLDVDLIIQGRPV